MKPLPNRPPNRIISANAFRADLTETEQPALRPADYSNVVMQTVKDVRSNVAKQPWDVAPSLAYGCVDWYLFPSSNRESR
jgi:hypothetical protein